MQPVEKVLKEHEAWYDSMCQDNDAWGCICDHVPRWRTRENVIDMHIMLQVREAELREKNNAASTRLVRDANGNLCKMAANGKLIRASSPGHIWEGETLQELLSHAQKQGMWKVVAALEDYEDERQRLERAVANADDQVEQLSTAYRGVIATHEKLCQILRDSGMDPVVLLNTDLVFAENEEPVAVSSLAAALTAIPAQNILKPTYCRHGNDTRNYCPQCP